MGLFCVVYLAGFASIGKLGDASSRNMRTTFPEILVVPDLFEGRL